MKINKELSIAKKAAVEAGKLIIKDFGKSRIIKFKSKVDFVTKTDNDSEKLITTMIKKNFPDHSILAEEGTRREKGSENLWIIDPLDGTTNFAHGYPFFSVSIALILKGRQVLGVVYDPIRNEMFHSIAGKGSYLNGKRIKVTNVKDLKDSIIIIGFWYDRGKIMRKTLEKTGEFFSEGIQGTRRSGSAALDLCYIASGRADGFWEFFLNPWDFAAGSLLVKEAGGIVTTTEGKPLEMKGSTVLATNKYLHKKMLEVLNR